MATQRLTASDITSKIATGTPMRRNELLPDVPKGMSARGFYGQFSGGASAYSQAPFKRSSSATDIFDPTEEDTSTADTTPTETQMEEVLSSSLNTSVRDENNTSEGTSISTPLDNISLEIPKELFDLEAIKEDFNNFNTIEEINTVLKNGSKNIIAAAEKGTNALLGELNALGEEINTITKVGPLNYIGRHVTDSIDSVVAIISDPFSKFSINTSLTYVGKSVGSNLLSGLFSSLGLGMAATPLGMITVAALSGVDLEEGQKGRHFDNSTQANPNTIAGYNAQGVAVNSEGKAGMIDGMYAFKSIGDWLNNFGKSVSEIKEDARASKMSADYDFVSGQEDGYTDVLNDPFAEQYQSALDKEEGFITPQINEQKPWTDIGPTWDSIPEGIYTTLNPAIYDGLIDPFEVDSDAWEKVTATVEGLKTDNYSPFITPDEFGLGFIEPPQNISDNQYYKTSSEMENMETNRRISDEIVLDDGSPDRRDGGSSITSSQGSGAPQSPTDPDADDDSGMNAPGSATSYDPDTSGDGDGGMDDDSGGGMEGYGGVGGDDW